MLTRPPDFAVYSWITPEEDPVPSLVELLQGAKQTIRVCAYGFTLAVIVDELIAAHQRGVDVRLILDASQAAGPAEQVQVKRLAAAGLPYITGHSAKGAIIHLKVFIVDSCLWFGSYNFTSSGVKQDNDAILIQLPANVITKHQTKFDAEWLRLQQRAAEKTTKARKSPKAKKGKRRK